MCPNCNKSLVPPKLTIGEYNQLKKSVEQNLMKNHLKATPLEMNYFKQKILSRRSQFDVIIDGLNVAYFMSSSKSSVIDQAKMVNLLK